MAGADSQSGKGLPGVNVYDWSVDRKMKHNPDGKMRRVDHIPTSTGLHNALAEVRAIEKGVETFLWPPIIPPKRRSQLRDTW